MAEGAQLVNASAKEKSSLRGLYYITDVVCLFFALRGLVTCEKLPANPQVVKVTGKEPLLK